MVILLFWARNSSCCNLSWPLASCSLGIWDFDSLPGMNFHYNTVCMYYLQCIYHILQMSPVWWLHLIYLIASLPLCESLWMLYKLGIERVLVNARWKIEYIPYESDSMLNVLRNYTGNISRCDRRSLSHSKGVGLSTSFTSSLTLIFWMWPASILINLAHPNYTLKML